MALSVKICAGLAPLLYLTCGETIFIERREKKGVRGRIAVSVRRGRLDRGLECFAAYGGSSREKLLNKRC